MSAATIRAVVKAMQAAGCPAEQIVAAVCALEDEADAAAAARRAKDRERKRAERAKAPPAPEPVHDVPRTQRTTADNVETTDTADKTASPLPSPKVSPKDNNQTPFLAPNHPPFPSRERAEIACASDEKAKRGEDFERFWRAMPQPDPAAKAAAQAAFARLDAADRTQAIAAAGRYASAYAAKPTTHPISPVRFLRERCFEGYGPPSRGSEAGPRDNVLVTVDTPQWRAWTAHRGKPIPMNREGTGWHFPSEWPPSKAERGVA
jgi:hypothetical protein